LRDRYFAGNGGIGTYTRDRNFNSWTRVD